jgi:hypothetical protein
VYVSTAQLKCQVRMGRSIMLRGQTIFQCTAKWPGQCRSGYLRLFRLAIRTMTIVGSRCHSCTRGGTWQDASTAELKHLPGRACLMSLWQALIRFCPHTFLIGRGCDVGRWKVFYEWNHVHNYTDDCQPGYGNYCCCQCPPHA